jgi:3-hydroxyacyl-CoA dehydrogenase
MVAGKFEQQAHTQIAGEARQLSSVPRDSSRYAIRKAAVLGAGTMGSRIAAHLANAGIAVVLLDLSENALSGNGQPANGTAGNPAVATGGANPSRIAQTAVRDLLKAKPAALFDPAFASRITPGNFDTDLSLLGDCDWVIEAVAENLSIKRALLAKVAAHLKATAILTTNTSGLPVATIGEELPGALRSRWLGTHFFNPPRYMRLVEIIATPETDPAAVRAVTDFAEQRLGKDVVLARDTPNFIANRIGVRLMLDVARLLEEEQLTIEEVDALTGTAIGFPRQGTFRLADMVGIDVLLHVARNFSASTAEKVEIPSFLDTMMERRWLGDKTGGGFYKKTKGEDGKEVRLALDWKTLAYRPAERAKLTSLEMAKNLEQLPARLRMLLEGDAKKDKAARFHWRLLSGLWNYAADSLEQIADDAASVDRAMRAGFNWELGPFAMWDAAGVRATVDRMRAEGQPVSAAVERLLAAGGESWYRDAGVECFDPVSGTWRPTLHREGVAHIADFRSPQPGSLQRGSSQGRSSQGGSQGGLQGIVRQNAGASVVDLGDGVACIELHSKKSAIGEDILRMVTETLDRSGESVRNFRAFVIHSDAENFSVGANLVQLLLSAQEGEWDEVEFAVRTFQAMTAAIKFSPRPVVVAPYALCLGGGTEMVLHAARRQAHAELYMGLVEAGVGLVPAGGGTKEIVLRATDAAARALGSIDQVAGSVELLDALKRAFESIAMAKVSTSAVEARGLGLLDTADSITANRDRLLMDAKRVAASLADAGYTPPLPRTDIPAAGESVLATLKLGVYLMREAGYASEHDQKVADFAAHILCGGRIAPGTRVSEQYLLDLEREAFLSLCGERKTQERIAYTLSNGKPLRN